MGKFILIKMDKNFYYINISNFETLRNKILDKLNLDLSIDINLVKYNEVFNLIPEINDILSYLSIESYKRSISIISVKSKGRLPIHKDDGFYIWSLNIPLSYTDNTYTVFYNVNEDDRIEMPSRNGGATYIKYPEEKAVEIDRFILDKPAIMNTKIAHNVINFNNKPRYTLGIRLNLNFNPLVLKKFFI